MPQPAVSICWHSLCSNNLLLSYFFDGIKFSKLEVNHYTMPNKKIYATTIKLKVQLVTNLALYDRAYMGFDISQVLFTKETLYTVPNSLPLLLKQILQNLCCHHLWEWYSQFNFHVSGRFCLTDLTMLANEILKWLSPQGFFTLFLVTTFKNWIYCTIFCVLCKVS